MALEQFKRRIRIEVPAAELFGWHLRDGAFLRLAPPWERVGVEKWAHPDRVGERVVIVMRVGPLKKRWVAEYREFEPGRLFRDVQVSGPFAHWDHRHRVTPDGDGAAWLEDAIEYSPPLGALGRLVAGGFVRRSLSAMFAYRQRTTRDDLLAHQRARRRLSETGATLRRVGVTGATGLVGASLASFLESGGHEVVRLPRPTSPEFDKATLEGLDAVVHLAGENVAARRWSASQKERILSSRVEGTQRLCERLAKLQSPPKVFVSASAVGFYGDRGDEPLDEQSSPGNDFLADVCRRWEAEAARAVEFGARVTTLRFGVVLSGRGGALTKMLTPFKLGAGGVLGSGRQYMSWIALDDAIGAIHHALVEPSLHGAVNAVAPTAVTNREFTKTLGRVLRRPTIFPMPAAVARLAFGEMADALLLASQRVAPVRLVSSGYPFRYVDLEDALRYQLGCINAEAERSD